MAKKNSNMVLEDNLASRVKELRKNMDLTQAEVAAALHVTPGYICNVENGRTAMSLRLLTYYAKLMGTTLDSLVGSLDADYRMTALDNELMQAISKMKPVQKKKLLETLRIWAK